MKLKFYFLAFFAFYLFTACSNEDDIFDSNANFYSNANTSVLENDLLGTWAIFNIEFEGNLTAIPINYEECGRDFLVFLENGIYKEYIYENNNCNYTSNTLNWSLSNGVITLSNQSNESDDAVILKLNKSDLIFKTRIDIDGDNELDVFTAYLKPFTPKEIDLVSDTFYRNTATAYRNQISYTWQAYKGNDEFVSYEIYRSSGLNCSKSNAVLIETITDKNNINFTDFTPPKEERLCYFLKTNIKSGVLGESDIQTIDTYTVN